MILLITNYLNTIKLNIMKEFINEAYHVIRKYVNDNHGTGKNFPETSEFKTYKTAMEDISLFDGKKVVLSYISENDFSRHKGEKIGKIKVEQDGRIRFYEGRKTARYYNIDAGLFEGWYATLIPIKISIYE